MSARSRRETDKIESMYRNTLSRRVLRRNFVCPPGRKTDLFRRQTDLSGPHSDLNRRSSSLFRRSSSLLGRSSSPNGRSPSPSCGETSLLCDDSSPNDRHSSLSHPETSPPGDGPGPHAAEASPQMTVKDSHRAMNEHHRCTISRTNKTLGAGARIAKFEAASFSKRPFSCVAAPSSSTRVKEFQACAAN